LKTQRTLVSAGRDELKILCHIWLSSFYSHISCVRNTCSYISYWISKNCLERWYTMYISKYHMSN